MPRDLWIFLGGVACAVALQTAFLLQGSALSSNQARADDRKTDRSRGDEEKKDEGRRDRRSREDREARDNRGGRREFRRDRRWRDDDDDDVRTAEHRRWGDRDDERREARHHKLDRRHGRDGARREFARRERDFRDEPGRRRFTRRDEPQFDEGRGWRHDHFSGFDRRWGRHDARFEHGFGGAGHRGAWWVGAHGGPPGLSAWFGSSAHAFARMDANHDGKITRDEMLAQFAKIDLNNDGAITRVELIANVLASISPDRETTKANAAPQRIGPPRAPGRRGPFGAVPRHSADGPGQPKLENQKPAADAAKPPEIKKAKPMTGTKEQEEGKSIAPKDVPKTQPQDEKNQKTPKPDSTTDKKVEAGTNPPREPITAAKN